MLKKIISKIHLTIIIYAASLCAVCLIIIPVITNNSYFDEISVVNRIFPGATIVGVQRNILFYSKIKIKNGSISKIIYIDTNFLKDITVYDEDKKQ